MAQLNKKAELETAFINGMERLSACLDIYQKCPDPRMQSRLLEFMNTHCTPELKAINLELHGDQT